MKPRHLIAATAFAATALTGGATAPAAARAPLCKDSNGTRPGGSVYLDYRTTVFVCDVRPPQRLHITHTPSAAACRAMSGHGWTSRYHICFDVDY